MKVTSTFSVVGALTAAAILSLAPLASASAQDTKPLVRAISSDVNSLDPHDTRGAVDQDIMLNIYEKLVEMEFKEQPNGTFVADPMGVVPNLAESWVLEGPKTIFKLRKDVKFYPTGNPMTADDVVYSFTRLVAFPANGKNQAGVAGIYTPDQIKKIDDYTVEVTHMDGPGGKPAEVAVRLTSFKFLQFGILNSVEVKKHATAEDPWAREWLQKNLATTGPYYIASRTPNQQLVLKTVPDRKWGPQPHVQGSRSPYHRQRRRRVAAEGWRRRLCRRGSHRSSVRRTGAGGVAGAARSDAEHSASVDGGRQAAIHRQARAAGDDLCDAGAADHQHRSWWTRPAFALRSSMPTT